MKKTYHTVETIPKSNRKFVDRSKIDAPNIEIQDISLSWLGTYTDTSIKNGGVKLVSLTQSFSEKIKLGYVCRYATIY